ncbi:MAG: hypothetical protein M4579_004454 [Chaenotheca gracillima]|nr:MAG: hypothetical protein M4579_004454 [Chaenotheca gracillima]
MHFSAALSLVLAASAAASPRAPALPTVDLGYTLQRASSLNSSAGYYNFTNIRYAQPPVGKLRFAAPVPPKKNRTVQTGEEGHVCYQALPAWELDATSFVTDVLTGGNITGFIANSTGLAFTPETLPPPTSRETEDCLFLDVIVPERAFKKKDKGEGAAVLVWIYGGGYVDGNKGDTFDPTGLIKRGLDATGKDVIYVAMNYRLGAFGFLSGPTFQEQGDANAGLLDQRLALEWVQQHIKKFGGNPKKVTVFGESAGGGSIMHQITAYGGAKGKAPFQQALPQSPGWFPLPGNFAQEQTYNAFLKYANVSNIAEARALSSIEVRNANFLQVGASAWGTFTYGPTVDGSFAPGLPGKLLLDGNYDKDLNIMVGHNADEGLDFSPPIAQTTDGFNQYLRTSFPDADDSVIDYITKTLYPAVFDGSLGYRSNIERTALLTSESIFTCNTNYLARAYGNHTHNYLYSVPPALHGQDVAYTFYNEPNPAVLVPSLAVALQEYITTFAINGKPSAKGTPKFPTYGSNGMVQNINVTGIEAIKDPADNARCLWWQKALYY